MEEKKLSIPMKMLQYRCEGCEFKLYMNMEDDLGEKIKCPKCGLEESSKKRIFDVTLNSYKELEKEEQKDGDTCTNKHTNNN